MHLRLVTGDYLVGCLAQILVDVETVDGMTRRVDCFGPKTIRSLVLIKHGSCGFNQCPILPLHNAILLWCIWSGELMLDSFFIKIFLNIGVSKFRAIVTSNILDLQLKFILSSSNEFLDNPLYFAFIMHKEYPSEMRKIINYNKTIFITANANVGDWPEEIHV